MTVRQILLDRLNDRHLPLIMAHGGGLGHGRENSIGAIREALKFSPDIVEVDVRKSRDGILYCYHGSIPFGVFAAQFFRFFTFAQIQRLVGKLDVLQPVIEVVPPSIDIYLDLKSNNITSADLNSLITGKPNIWVTAYKIPQLTELRSGLGENFVYVLNRPFILLRLRDVAHLVGLTDMAHLFRWQWSHVVIYDIESKGIACHLAHWFLDLDEQKQKADAASPYKGIYLHYDDLLRVHR